MRKSLLAGISAIAVFSSCYSQPVFSASADERLTDRVLKLEGTVKTLEGTVDTRIKTLEGTVGTIDSRVKTLENQNKPDPQLVLTALPTAIAAGQPLTTRIHWEATNVESSCNVIAPASWAGDKPATGDFDLAVPAGQTTTVAMTCPGLNGTSVTQTVMVTAAALPVTPPVTPPATDPVADTTPTNVTIGQGENTLVLNISQDLYQGLATYTVKVDGAQVGGTLTAHALHTNPVKDVVTVKGNWPSGNHTVEVRMLQDPYGGSPDKDRNVYVEGATFNGAAVPSSTLFLNNTTAKTFVFNNGAIAEPALSFTGPSSALVNFPFTPNWQSNLPKCDLSGGASGSFAGTGSQSVTISTAGSAAFPMVCSAPDGKTITKSPTVNVAAANNPVPQAAPKDDLKLTNASGAPVTNYPFQFGRPFVQGEISKYPQVVVDGTARPTQADVKNRWPDGSVKFAIISTMIPTLPANASVTMTFQNQDSGNNTPLTSAEMLDSAYNFDAVMQLIKPASVTGTASADLTKWKVIKDGSLAVSVDGVPYQATGIDFSTVAGINYLYGITNAVVNAKFPFKAYFTNKGKGIAFGGQSISIGKPTIGTDIAPLLFGDPVVAEPPSSPVVASARKMLEDGACKPWTQGQVAQTLLCADDSVERKFDLGFNANRAVRPRFYVTFWPATKQVFVRYVGEISNTEAIESQFYNLKLTLGASNPQTVYEQKNIPHSVWTRWTRSYWLNGAPEPKININHNVGYLAATYMIPNYDPTVVVPDAALGYTAWAATDKSIGGPGWWLKGMGTTGGRPDIAPMPAWSTKWFYNGSWQARQIALGQADLAGAWPMQTREGKAGKFVDRDGKVPGLGRPMTKYGRPTLYGCTGSAADKLVFLNSYDASNCYDLWQNSQWTPDGAHQPDPYYPQYLLTGDYFYLEGVQLWAASGSFCGPGSAPWNCLGSVARIKDQVRGMGWRLRNRLNAWVVTPDADPLKSVFSDAVHDALASWEGQFDIRGTQYEGTPAWNFTHSFVGTVNDGWGGKGISPLGWADAGAYDPKVHSGSPHFVDPAVTFSANALWMHNYFTFGVARAAELGFPAKPLLNRLAQLYIGPLTTPGYPPHLLGQYVVPDRKTAVGADGKPMFTHFTSWTDTLSGWQEVIRNDPTMPTSYWPSTSAHFTSARMATAMVANEPGGKEAWTAMENFVAAKTALTKKPLKWSDDPSWNIIPRVPRN